MILGTLLPLSLNNQVATPSGGVILAGLAIAAVGLFSSMKSLQLRNEEEIQRNKDDKEDEDDEPSFTNADEETGAGESATESSTGERITLYYFC